MASGLVGDLAGLTYVAHLKEGCRRSELVSSCARLVSECHAFRKGQTSLLVDPQTTADG